MANRWSNKACLLALLLFYLGSPAGAVDRPLVYVDHSLPTTTVALLFQYGYMDELEHEVGVCQLYLAYMRRLAYEHPWVVDCRYLLQARASVFILTVRNRDLPRLPGLYQELLAHPLTRQELPAELGPLLADKDSKAIRAGKLPYLISLMKRYLFYPRPAARLAWNPQAYDSVGVDKLNTWLPLFHSCLHTVYCYCGNRQQAAAALDQIPVHSFPASPAQAPFSWEMEKQTEELSLPVPMDTHLYGVVFTLKAPSDRWLVALLHHHLSHDLLVPSRLEWAGERALLYFDLTGETGLARLLTEESAGAFWPGLTDKLAGSYASWRLEMLITRQDPLSWLEWLADTGITGAETDFPPQWQSLRERMETEPPHLSVYVLQVKGVDL